MGNETLALRRGDDVVVIDRARVRIVRADKVYDVTPTGQLRVGSDRYYPDGSAVGKNSPWRIARRAAEHEAELRHIANAERAAQFGNFEHRRLDKDLLRGLSHEDCAAVVAHLDAVIEIMRKK